MVKKRLVQLSLLVVIALLVVAIPVYAADVTDALYNADIVATNTGTAATDVAAAVSINTQALLDGNYVSADLLNTALQTSGGTDIAYMPGVGTNPWVFWLSSIGQNESKANIFYCGGPAMQTGFDYFPDSGGMTTADNTSLELGNNFQIEQKGWVDTTTGVNKNLVLKLGAYKVYISGEGIISAGIDLNPTKLTDPTTLPTGIGRGDAFTSDGTYLAVAHDTTPYVTIYKRDGDTFTKLTNPTTLPTGTGFDAAFTSDGTYLAVAHTTSPYVTIYKRSGDTFTKLTNPTTLPTGTGYDAAFTSDGTYLAVAHDVSPYVTIYKSRLSVTATGITSGVRTVRTSADGTNLTIQVYDEDDVLIDDDTIALGGASVPNTADNWSFLTNSSMSYMEYHKIWIGGTAPADLKQHIVYERDTTFDDLTENNNDATPTFRTTSSDAHVSVIFENFEPINEAECSAGAGGEETEMLTSTPEPPSELYGAEEGGSENIPGADVINPLLENANIPPDFFWITMVYFVLAAGAVLLSYQFIRSSLLFPCIAGFVIILVFALMTKGDPIPLWTILPYILNCSGFLVMEKTFGW